MSYPHINDRRLLQMIPLTTSQEGKCAWELWKDLPQCRSAVAVQARTGQLRTERTKSEKASRTYHSLLGGSAAFSTTGSGRAVATAAASSGPERQDGHPLSTRGPQVPPTAVSCRTQVQSSTVVVARATQSFIRDRAAAEDVASLNLPPAKALPPVCAFHPISHGPTLHEDERNLRRRGPSGATSSSNPPPLPSAGPAYAQCSSDESLPLFLAPPPPRRRRTGATFTGLQAPHPRGPKRAVAPTRAADTARPFLKEPVPAAPPPVEAAA
jgi:hypothetical protein